MKNEVNFKFEECKWCNGSGDDGGGYHACLDCESTGLNGGHDAVKLMDKAIEESFNKNLKIEIVDCEECGGSGFNKPGTGYDAVCDHCGGQGKHPKY